ncbi:unnamed protein product [Durusdinium trenchii]|uniref:Uncharacterized protein n=2 Tax=Durusdinium trenchii TaxID=1381693 RepID=A0ABP0M4T3_9DINO
MASSSWKSLVLTLALDAGMCSPYQWQTWWLDIQARARNLGYSPAVIRDCVRGRACAGVRSHCGPDAKKDVAIHNESYRLLLLFSASVALLVGLATANLPRLEEDKQNRVEGAWFMFNFQCLERNTEEALILLQKHGLLCGDRMVL